jgi:hypothetical protein
MTRAAPKTRSWYTNQAVADRPGYAIVFTMVDSKGHLWMSFQRPDSEVELLTPWRDVTGYSATHIDRLARDWIGHGVSPTKDGRRGVRKWPASGPDWKTITHGWKQFSRNEARAKRVVAL